MQSVSLPVAELTYISIGVQDAGAKTDWKLCRQWTHPWPPPSLQGAVTGPVSQAGVDFQTDNLPGCQHPCGGGGWVGGTDPLGGGGAGFPLLW